MCAVDLVLAAEYGQSLLDANEALRRQLAAADAAAAARAVVAGEFTAQANAGVVRAAERDHYRERARELEQTVLELQAQRADRADADSAEARSLARRVRAAEDAAAASAQALAAAEQAAADSDARAAALEVAHLRMADELRVAKVLYFTPSRRPRRPSVAHTQRTHRPFYVARCC
jgi:hypothetical protein